MGRPPDFLGLGAQRAGTSWMYACLYEHPEVCAPRKEINFFSRERHWTRGYGWYESHFEECPPGQRAGEWSTSYLHHPETPHRIHDRYPDVQLLVSLRNPVERAFSGFRNDIMAGEISPSTSFEEALRKDPQYVDIGRYARHLERYLEWFSRDQMGVLIYEECQEDPAGFLRKLFRLLGVDPGFEPSLREETVNRSREPRFPGIDALLNRLSKGARSNPLTRPVWWLAKKSGLGEYIRGVNTVPGDERRLDSATRRALHDAFGDEITRLENLLGISLDRWRRTNLEGSA